jgi:hypothetical protein
MCGACSMDVKMNNGYINLGGKTLRKYNTWTPYVDGRIMLKHTFKKQTDCEL